MYVELCPFFASTIQSEVIDDATFVQSAPTIVSVFSVEVTEGMTGENPTVR